jgi:tight adherence protein C
MDLISTVFAPLCAGISVFCIVLYVVYAMEQIQVDSQAGNKPERRELPVLLKLFMPLTPNAIPIAKHESFDSYRGQVNEQILMAGYDNTIDADHFIALRVIVSFFGVLTCIGISMAGEPLYGLVVLLLLFIYPQAWLKKTIAKRHLAIQKALPNLLDLLTLSVQAGKDFLTSMRDILARRKIDPLGEELERTFREIQLGKKRADALKDLVKRVQQPDLSSVINAIIQADELGVSIAELLKIQGDQLRMKRFQRAEKMANEAPVKMLFPVALFIFPSVLIIMGAPLAMQAMQALFK